MAIYGLYNGYTMAIYICYICHIVSDKSTVTMSSFSPTFQEQRLIAHASVLVGLNRDGDGDSATSEAPEGAFRRVAVTGEWTKVPWIDIHGLRQCAFLMVYIWFKFMKLDEFCGENL